MDKFELKNILTILSKEKDFPEVIGSVINLETYISYVKEIPQNVFYDLFADLKFPIEQIETYSMEINRCMIYLQNFLDEMNRIKNIPIAHQNNEKQQDLIKQARDIFLMIKKDLAKDPNNDITKPLEAILDKYLLELPPKDLQIIKKYLIEFIKSDSIINLNFYTTSFPSRIKGKGDAIGEPKEFH